MYYIYIIYYLLPGILFNMLYDLMVDWLHSRGHTDNIRFSMKERIAVAIIWPIYLTFFARTFFIQFFKNKNND